MRWLRIAIGFTVSLMTALLCSMPAQAAEGNLWSALLDHRGDLQLGDVSSARFSNQFSPIELEAITAASPDQALWLRFRLKPDKHEQVLRVFAPDLLQLELYVLDGNKLISEVSTGSNSRMRRAMKGSIGAPPRSTLRMDNDTSISSRSLST